MRIIVLASTSPYRLQLMRRLQIKFDVAAPLYHEQLDHTVAPELLVKHQALHKAKSLEGKYPNALIIGSDQVFVDAKGRVLGKPLTEDVAVRQLSDMQGRTHTFYTGLSVYDSCNGRHLTDYETFMVSLRKLRLEQIKKYVSIEQPLNCSGSFKIEGLGIALMEDLEGHDYTSLIGLPLVRLVGMLKEFGVDVLS